MDGIERCIDDEIPFDVPENWAWARLANVCNIFRGVTFPASEKYKSSTRDTIPCATTGSVQREYNVEADVFVPKKYVKSPNQWLISNDIIMSTANSRELVGKTCLWYGDEQKTFGGFLTVIRTRLDLSEIYMYFVLQWQWFTGRFNGESTQTTNIANINNEILNNTLVPVPPIVEQQRIVKRIGGLVAIADKL